MSGREDGLSFQALKGQIF